MGTPRGEARKIWWVVERQHRKKVRESLKDHQAISANQDGGGKAVEFGRRTFKERLKIMVPMVSSSDHLLDLACSYKSRKCVTVFVMVADLQTGYER